MTWIHLTQRPEKTVWTERVEKQFLEVKKLQKKTFDVLNMDVICAAICAFIEIEVVGSSTYVGVL